MQLYHYCCSCSARLITRRGLLRPRGRAQFGVDLIWLTDQATPDREGLGLTSRILKCDRLEYQYVVTATPSEVESWSTSDVRRWLMARDYEGDFTEFERGRQPETWWIARRPIFAIQNRAYRRPESVADALALFGVVVS